MIFNDLIPMLETENIAQTTSFYCNILGFDLQGKYPDHDEPSWISLKKDKTVLMFSERFENTKRTRLLMTGSLYFYPDDVIQLWEVLKDKVSIEWALQEFHYGMREFVIKDNNGYRLIFGESIDESA